tara:strand:+ start:336 stop:680 length:345 start_codon:yes stop_codon:yes gene_type:complete
MKKTKFSIQTDIENKEVTFFCHFKLEGVMNHSTIHSFDISAQRDINDEITDLSIIINDKESFKSMCQVLGVSQKVVNKFINTCIRTASIRLEDVRVEHQPSKWLREFEHSVIID